MNFPNDYSSKDERVKLWKEEIRNYINNANLIDLALKFGFQYVEYNSLLEQVSHLHMFAKKHWDYRQKHLKAERSAVLDTDDLVIKNSAQIINIAKELQLIKTLEFSADYSFDYIIPLGGYRIATYDRIKFSKNYLSQSTKLVTLTAHRKIDDIEKPYLSFVPNIDSAECTEFLSACYATENIFSCTKHQNKVEHINDSTGIVRNYNNNKYVICTPTPLNKKRAQTLDTVDYFYDKFRPTPKSRILFITSPIYRSYQMAALADFVFRKDLYCDFTTTNHIGAQNKVIANYLQEIKATLDMFLIFLTSE